jgi:hypothetical protein
MAEIVTALASANSPMLILSPEQWLMYAETDKQNPQLYDPQGRTVNYEQLVKLNGDRYAREASLERFKQQHTQIQRALERQATELAAAKPDVVVILSYVSRDLFGLDNQPGLYIFGGPKMISRGHPLPADAPAWMRDQAAGWGQDRHREFPVASSFARELASRLATQADVAYAEELPNPANLGFGHIFTYPAMRLIGDSGIAVVPIAINVMMEPNIPPPARCYAIGQALAAALDAVAGRARVAIVSSASLCHFTVNEALDGQVVRGLREGKPELLRGVPVSNLNGQNGQLRIYITLGGILQDRPIRWSEYLAIYRTPAGTGVGLLFAGW